MGLESRHRVAEWMDSPNIDPAEHCRALRGLERINRISRTGPVLCRAIDALIGPHPEGGTIRALDIACGGGDLVRALARRGLDVAGCDLSPTAIALARQRAANAPGKARFFQHDVFRDPLPDGFDVVTCSLFLHHLADDQARDLLARMAEAARRLVLVDDLVRGRSGLFLAWWGCRLCSWSPVVHHDGPASVRAAFTPGEALQLARRAGMVGATLTRHWPQRFLLSWTRPTTTT